MQFSKAVPTGLCDLLRSSAKLPVIRAGLPAVHDKMPLHPIKLPLIRGMDRSKPIGKLSPKEQQLVQLINDGLSRALIAERLNITLSTYDSYRKSIRSKLGIRTQKDWAALLATLNRKD